jgi:putative endonuclease
MNKQYYIYILASKRNGTLYIGVTSDLRRRMYEHKNKIIPGFTQKYNISNLVHIEAYDNPNDAILREKRLKTWKRAWKIDLIEKENPGWRDLYHDIKDWN